MVDVLPFVEDTTPSPDIVINGKNSKNSKTENKEPTAKSEKQEEHTAGKSEETRKDGENENSRDRRKDRELQTIDTLSFDQINDDADELIELRGEGRYFGVTDPTLGRTVNTLQGLGPLCANCHKRGHIRAKCKTVVCHKCGVVGDHYETQCPTTMICSRCGQKGHGFSTCTNKMKKRQYCRTCDTFSHGEDHCPTIWRSYVTNPASEISAKLPIVYCYNCGSQTHFGDDCREFRTSRVPNTNGSAFGGDNLPRTLRQFYYDILRGKSNKNNSNKRQQNIPKRTGILPRKDTKSGPGAALANRIQALPVRSGYMPRRPDVKQQKKYGQNSNGKKIAVPTRSGFIDHRRNTQGKDSRNFVRDKRMQY